MERFVGKEEEFLSNAGLDRGPVKVNEGIGNVLPGLNVGGNPW